MLTQLKKLLLVSITLLLGAMCSWANADTNYDFGGTTYTLSIYNGTWSQFQSAEPSYSNVAITPWWGNQSAAEIFALGVGTNLGFVDNSGLSSVGPMFAFSGSPLTTVNYSPGDPEFPPPRNLPDAQSFSGWGESLNFNWTYVSSSSPAGSAPEMNASFIPQVALMLACLFFLLGRKKENTDAILAA